jgi:hypothetical protein
MEDWDGMMGAQRRLSFSRAVAPPQSQHGLGRELSEHPLRSFDTVVLYEAQLESLDSSAEQVHALNVSCPASSAFRAMDFPHVEQATLTRFSYLFLDADESPISGDSGLRAVQCLPEEVIMLVSGDLEDVLVDICCTSFFLFTGSATCGASRSPLSTMGFASNLSAIA